MQFYTQSPSIKEHDKIQNNEKWKMMVKLIEKEHNILRVITCANLPSAKADISWSSASGDLSMSTNGGIAPLWQIWTYMNHKIWNSIRGFHNWQIHHITSLQKTKSTLQSESVVANWPIKRAASLWLSGQEELSLKFWNLGGKRKSTKLQNNNMEVVTHFQKTSIMFNKHHSSMDCL